MRRISMILALAASSALSCGKQEAPAKPQMTQRQRDSVIGASKLPGARGVQNALRAQDSIQARNNRLDSIN